MYRRYEAKRELGRLTWKIQARRQRQETNRYNLMSVKIQCWWRGMLAQRIYLVKLRHNVEIIPDLARRRLSCFAESARLPLSTNIQACLFRYYCNHNNGECTWTPPSRGASVLHPPQDYVVALEDNNLYYVKWSVSSLKPHIRTWTKPAGYLRCTSCLQNLALLRCEATPGVFCFRCFRDTFQATDFLRDDHQQQRVGPIFCEICHHDRLAAWWCAVDAKCAKSSRVVCGHCHQRLGDAKGWLRL